MKFSICIPNYNYEHYVGETVASVLGQTHKDLEIRLSDNASTDASVRVVEAFGDSRVHIHVNRRNVGFAGNLDRACAGATGDAMILVSSDDLLEPEALATYDELYAALGDLASRTIICAAYRIIDGEGNITGGQRADPKYWAAATIDPALSAIVGAEVLRIPAETLLGASMRLLRVPSLWLTMAYPRSLYEQVEGYGGARYQNPDKAFGWKIIAAADEVLFVQKPLFRYRVHGSNQAAVQTQSGALKHISDEYANTFDTPPDVLARAGLSQSDLAKAFIEQDIGLRGLQFVAQGKREEARRGLNFGKAAYPALTAANRKVWALRALLALGPVGTMIAARLHRAALARWSAAQASLDS